MSIESTQESAETIGIKDTQEENLPTKEIKTEK